MFCYAWKPLVPDLPPGTARSGTAAVVPQHHCCAYPGLITSHWKRTPRQPQLLETPNSNQPYSHGLGEGARSEAEKPWISFWLFRNIACCRVGQGLWGYMNCQENAGLEMEWALEHTEFGHFSIIGSHFQQLQWMWSSLGRELLMTNNCSERAFILYLVNDRSSEG